MELRDQMNQPEMMPLTGYESYSPEETRRRTADFYRELKGRRTVRHFSDRPVPREIIMDCLQAATTAPSGANHQPWHFVAISDPDLKRRIRQAAEEEERAFYGGRATTEWLEALAPLGTNADKPFLEIAPYLIAIFAQSYGLDPGNQKIKHYYVQESVGIATGFLIAAIHHAGLASLTHTPSPMGFLNQILGRPKNERPFLLLVVGYPAPGAEVPRITKKPRDEVISFI
jgi:iodotyrosine deiodinase